MKPVPTHHRAVALLEPLDDRTGAVALRGAAEHLLASLAPVGA